MNSEQAHDGAGEPKRRSRGARLMIRAGWISGLFAVLIALFLGSFFLTMRLAFTGREVAVPDLTGMSVEEARSALARAQLYLEAAAERYDDHVEKGRVLAQDPRAGATTKRDRKVKVTLSLGTAQLKVPDVRGQSARTAQIALQREGLAVGHVTSVHDGRTLADVVMAQHPEPDSGGAGVQVIGGKARVDLLVSRGRRQPVYVMPDLSSRTIAEVTAFAQRAGLRVGAVRRERVPGAERDTVVRQYPEAGRPVGRQDIISLVIAQ